MPTLWERAPPAKGKRSLPAGCQKRIFGVLKKAS